ncbi:hypothetical protein EDD86DRAFT_249933 [Gorgonomyces haynaldii]|nr:hypothetical protein EDD86DRAFT_249933 [Gorgonomyces haynaldii]
MLTNKFIEPLEVCYLLHILLKDSHNPRVWRKISVPGHFTLTKLLEAIRTAFDWKEAPEAQFFIAAQKNKKQANLTGFKTSDRGFEKTVEEVFANNEVIFLDFNVCKSGKGAAPPPVVHDPLEYDKFKLKSPEFDDRHFSRKMINVNLKEVVQIKEFRWV